MYEILTKLDYPYLITHRNFTNFKFTKLLDECEQWCRVSLTKMPTIVREIILYENFPEQGNPARIKINSYVVKFESYEDMLLFKLRWCD